MQAVIYTKKPCPFCDRAKMVFDKMGIGYTELDAVSRMDEMNEKVTEATGHVAKTVPQIWLDDQYVGGFTQLVEHFRK